MKWWPRRSTPQPLREWKDLVRLCIAAISEAGWSMYGQAKIDNRDLVWSGPYELMDIDIRYGQMVPVEGMPGVYYWTNAADGMIVLALGPRRTIRATLWPERNTTPGT